MTDVPGVVKMFEKRSISRMPKLSVASNAVYVIVICTGQRKSGRSCNRSLGYLNINHPHDVKYVCRDCGSEYVLQKS
jgi:hypothetical protein